jgi:hypothetical protein
MMVLSVGTSGRVAALILVTKPVNTKAVGCWLSGFSIVTGIEKSFRTL